MAYRKRQCEVRGMPDQDGNPPTSPGKEVKTGRKLFNPSETGKIQTKYSWQAAKQRQTFSKEIDPASRHLTLTLSL